MEDRGTSEGIEKYLRFQRQLTLSHAFMLSSLEYLSSMYLKNVK